MFMAIYIEDIMVNTAISRKWPIGHYGTAQYRYINGHLGCPVKDWPTCRSPFKILNWWPHSIKNYDQKKCMSDFMAIFFVFWPDV